MQGHGSCSSAPCIEMDCMPTSDSDSEESEESSSDKAARAAAAAARRLSSMANASCCRSVRCTASTEVTVGRGPDQVGCARQCNTKGSSDGSSGLPSLGTCLVHTTCSSWALLTWGKTAGRRAASGRSARALALERGGGDALGRRRHRVRHRHSDNWRPAKPVQNVSASAIRMCRAVCGPFQQAGPPTTIMTARSATAAPAAGLSQLMRFGSFLSLRWPAQHLQARSPAGP